jgi:hypothetical protein
MYYGIDPLFDITKYEDQKTRNKTRNFTNRILLGLSQLLSCLSLCAKDSVYDDTIEEMFYQN